ncbi:MAG: tRNA preQ1(34) S-adenosylmethionine ribosyltransferase-isomerase QueA [Desulfobulbaceae bacterium A2]|nr:MAG: tRNA preQ1(34) S-adenosylmethionine ribosyltransferase-isomerase QueA [Desulfobulbaceae bacterium A2]
MSDERYDLAAYDYELPPEAIAQHPLARRDASRLLVLDCRHDELQHRRFDELPLVLREDDLLVLNDTRVFPARLHGRKKSGGRIELLLLHYPLGCDEGSGGGHADCTVLARGIQGLRPGARLLFSPDLEGELLERLPEQGQARVRLHHRGDLGALLEALGQLPLPPYIHRPNGNTTEDRERYQTSYAAVPGAVAAPTAGLHFSDALLERLHGIGVRTSRLTLHVGHGTFAPVRSEDIRRHLIHREYVTIPEQCAVEVNRQRRRGGRIWAVGTTTTRAMESMTDEQGTVRPGTGWCDFYIHPPYRFRTVDNLITNFHLPRSSLLFLVSALAGRERILASYREAVKQGYRFFSYGDAMAIITKP